MALTARQLERARQIRAAMDAAGSNLTDAEALRVAPLYREWTPGEIVASGDIRRVDGQLYRYVQEDMVQANEAPDQAPQWVCVSQEEGPTIARLRDTDAIAKGTK